jgi:hypothetical protein
MPQRRYKIVCLKGDEHEHPDISANGKLASYLIVQVLTLVNSTNY